MNRKETFALCLIVLALTCSLTAVLYPASSLSDYCAIPDSENTQRLAVSVPLVLGTALHNKASILNQPTRLEIYTFIRDNPGVHFRGITSSLALSVGVVQYHVDVLVRAGLIKSYGDGQNTRYFAANCFTENEAKLIMLLRHPTARSILSLLIEDGSATHKDIAQAVGISLQALSWQMSQLRKTGFIAATKEGVNVMYVLSEKDAAKIGLFLDLCGNQRM